MTFLSVSISDLYSISYKALQNTLQGILLLNYIFKGRNSYHVETGYDKFYKIVQNIAYTRVLLISKQKVYLNVKFGR